MFGAWVVARLLEPSTWAGVAIIANGVSQAAATKDWSSLVPVIGGGLAVILSEGKNPAVK